MARRSFTQVIKDWFTRTTNKAAEFVAKRRVIQYDRAQWVALLDVRTCPTCGVRHGTVWPLADRHPNPPAHPRCRCIIHFIRRDEKPLPSEDFEDWMREQDDDAVAEILGKAKAELFLEGKLALSQFVDDSGKRYTLEDLHEQHTAIYEKVLGP